MFAFVKRRWAEGNPWKWAGLFAFEFLVVLLGVLVAQSLQERFELRREEERFATTQAVLNEQLQSAADSLIIRGLQAPCIRENLMTVREAARRGSDADLSKITRHPPHMPATLNVWSSEVARDARRFLEPEQVASYDYTSNLATDLTALRREEEEWWANILMASEGAAPLSRQERSDVVLASYKLDHAFEGWEHAVLTFVARLDQFNLQPNIAMIEQIHQGDGVCAAEVRALLPSLRQLVADAEEDLD